MEKDKEKTYIASNLKYLRNVNNKSLNDIAHVCDKTDVAIHYWENGTREPNAVDIAKLSNFFNITVDDLLTKDLRLENNTNNIRKQRYAVLYDKIKGLSDDDLDLIDSIVETRIKQIDKELREDNQG